MQVAGLLRLHREETYTLSDNATTEDIVKAEIARRTFWVLESEFTSSHRHWEFY